MSNREPIHIGRAIFRHDVSAQSMQEDDRSSIYRTLDDLLRGTQTPEGLPPLSLESEGLRLQVPVIIHDMSDLSSMGLELARKSEFKFILAWTTENGSSKCSCGMFFT